MPKANAPILVIEDDPGDFGLVQTYLRQAGLERTDTTLALVWATSLAQGIAKARSARPDVILLDLSLPDSCGLATVQALRQAVPEVPIVVLTGQVDSSLALATLESGAQDYLVKGCFDQDSLGRAVRYARIRARLEQELARSVGLYAALSHCNQAIVHCSQEGELLQAVCRIAVQFAGMKMAWIGLVDEATACIRPATSFGQGVEYLQQIEISTDVCSRFGQGPSGTAVREDRPYWCQDFLGDPVTAPWQQRAGEFAWGASASLPLHRDGRVVGVFVLYTAANQVFDPAAQKLLTEMAADISFALDNFARKAQRLKTEEVLRKLSQAVEQSSHSVVITDLTGHIEYVNAAFLRSCGYALSEVLGHNPRLLKSGKTTAAVYVDLWAALRRGEAWHGEFVNRASNGREYTDAAHISPIRHSDGRITHYLSIQEDITLSKQANERIQWLSHFDALTGLANHSLLSDRFDHATSMAQRSGRTLVLLMLDLDHFKNINDTLGRHIGDALLIEVARRIQSVVRDEDTVSRQGGDEFVLLMPTTDATGGAHAAEKLLAAMAGNFLVETHELTVTPSIGIAVYPADGATFEALSVSADVAMYRAKRDGRNCYRFFTAEMQAGSARTLQLESGLRRALQRQQLSLHYQPQLSLQDGRIVGAEALLRWQHPEFGMVSPSEFIPIAEASGQMVQLGEWVLRTAVRQMKAWLDDGLLAHTAGLEPVVMAVNLSVVQFRYPRLVEQVVQILQEEGLPAQHLELELTEGVALIDPVGAIAVMNALHAHGIRLSIDDFGTGYSSLSYLKQFKVYKLKIDQSFVRDLSDDPDDKAIVSAVISMARSLGLKTIAEGVETEGQLAFLRSSGCNEVQGYFFSRPVPQAAFSAFVRRANGLGPDLNPAVGITLAGAA